jgi:peptidoglycan/LPS O-acetylase OafA/YrhL
VASASSTGQIGRFSVLDSLRGVSSLQIVIYHYVLMTGALLEQYWFLRNTWLWLDFFFVLSGFVMTYVYGDRLRDARSTMGFAVRRFGRIWPLHISVLAALVAFIGVINLALPHHHWWNITPTTPPFGYLSLITEFFLLNAVGIWDDYHWNGPSWSIGAEFYVYIIFAVVCLLARRARVVVAAAMVAVGLAAMAIWSPRYLHSTIDFGIFRCIAGFFVGVIAYRSYAHVARRPRRSFLLRNRWIASIAEVAALGAVMAALYFIYHLGPLTWHSLVVPLLFGAVVYVFAFASGVVSRMLDTSVFRRLGDLSYSIYITHVPLLYVLWYGLWLAKEYAGVDVQHHVMESSRLWSALGLLVFAAVVVMVSGVTYRTIEVPWRERFAAIGRRIERGGSRQAQVQAAE